MSLETFKGTRAWLQRISDSKLFAGWMKELNRADAVVDIPSGNELRAGQEFMVQAFGPSACATFRTRLRLMSGTRGSFAIEGEVRFLKSTEEPRMKVSGVTATIEDDYAPFEAQVVDISSSGMGMVSSIPLEKGETVKLTISTLAGPVGALAEVRYNRQVSENPIAFRIGLKLQPLARLNQARWNRLLDGSAAA